MGGPGYRVHYPNGDVCSYVSVVYDAEGVAERGWFHRDEIAALALDPLNRQLLRDVGVL